MDHTIEVDKQPVEVLHLRGISVVPSKRGYTVIIGQHYKSYQRDLAGALQDVYEHYVKIRASEETKKTMKDLMDLLVLCKNEVIMAATKGVSNG